MQNLIITIYSIPKCIKCEQIKNLLKTHNINYKEICDFDETLLIAEKHNILSAPVIKIDGIYYDYNTSIILLKDCLNNGVKG